MDLGPRVVHLTTRFFPVVAFILARVDESPRPVGPPPTWSAFMNQPKNSTGPKRWFPRLKARWPNVPWQALGTLTAMASLGIGVYQGWDHAPKEFVEATERLLGEDDSPPAAEPTTANDLKFTQDTQRTSNGDPIDSSVVNAADDAAAPQAEIETAALTIETRVPTETIPDRVSEPAPASVTVSAYPAAEPTQPHAVALYGRAAIQHGQTAQKLPPNYDYARFFPNGVAFDLLEKADDKGSFRKVRSLLASIHLHGVNDPILKKVVAWQIRVCDVCIMAGLDKPDPVDWSKALDGVTLERLARGLKLRGQPNPAAEAEAMMREVQLLRRHGADYDDEYAILEDRYRDD